MGTVTRKKFEYVFVFSYLNGAMVIFTACMMNEQVRTTFANRNGPL